MAKRPTPAPDEVKARFDRIKKAHHNKRLENARIAVMFREEPAFKKGRFNWGSVKKCDPVTQALSDLSNADEYDFVIIVPEDAWEFCTRQNALDGYTDLFLTRCSVEFEPETKLVPGKGDKPGKEKPVKDDWGRIKYTDNPKYDEDGNPKWTALPLDLHVLTDNVGRYGPWCEDFEDFSNACARDDKGVATPSAPPSNDESEVEDQSGEDTPEDQPETGVEGGQADF